MMREIKQTKDSDVLLPTISAVITQSRALFGQKTELRKLLKLC